MYANVRFLCPEYFSLIPNGTYEFPDGSTVQECVESCVAEFGVVLQDTWPEQVVLMKDNKPVGKNEKVTEGSNILIVRRVLGG